MNDPAGLDAALLEAARAVVMKWERGAIVAKFRDGTEGLETLRRVALSVADGPGPEERRCRRRAGDGEECGLLYGHELPHHPRARVEEETDRS